jgi:GT2 family glycosyltransferase
VVVVSYRPGRWLAPALAAAVREADQVVLVDNGSSERAASAVGHEAGADVVRLEENVGFPAAVNLGVGRATGDVLALLNDDAIPDEGWIAGSLPTLADERVAAVAPKLLLQTRFAELRFPDQPRSHPPDPRPLGRMLHEVTVDGRDVLRALVGGIHRFETGPLAGVERQWRWTAGADAVYVPIEDDDEASRIVVDGERATPVRLVHLVNNAGSYLSAEGHAGDRGWLAPDDGQFDEGRECFAACGAAMVFTRRTWEQVGPFPASFFAYYEDVDWCWRARLRGLRIEYRPEVVVRHVGSATSGGEASPAVRLMSARNRLHVLARNAPLGVVRRQLERTKEPDLPAELHAAARRRVARGLLERLQLRRRWLARPDEVWDRWAGVDESWEDPGRAGGPLALPPRLAFGE